MRRVSGQKPPHKILFYVEFKKMDSQGACLISSRGLAPAVEKALRFQLDLNASRKSWPEAQVPIISQVSLQEHSVLVFTDWIWLYIIAPLLILQEFVGKMVDLCPDSPFQQ